MNGDLCTSPDQCVALASCQGGTCDVDTLLDCDDSNDCTADACDSLTGCTNSAIVGCVPGCFVSDPGQVSNTTKLILKDLADDPDDRDIFVRSNGFFFAAEDPPIAPELNGVHIRVAQADTVLYEINIPGSLQVPGGDYSDKSALCGRKGEGWRAIKLTNGKLIWKYVNRTGLLPLPGDTPGNCTGDANGMDRVIIWYRGPTLGYKALIRTKNHVLLAEPIVPVTDLRFTLSMGAQIDPALPTSEAIAGQCTAGQFTDEDCRAIIPEPLHVLLCKEKN
ncbi:MAG: hypothetical protein JRH10_16210 [Deltaproteobacteria bacterium]|nr:hypothetical protein [Deltaproteobacteria bacterium]